MNIIQYYIVDCNILSAYLWTKNDKSPRALLYKDHLLRDLFLIVAGDSVVKHRLYHIQ